APAPGFGERLVHRGVEVLAGRDAEVVAEHREEGAVGNGAAEGRAAALEEDDRLVRESAAELVHEPRFPRARLADDGDDLRRAAAHALVRGEELVELARAAEEG